MTANIKIPESFYYALATRRNNLKFKLDGMRSSRLVGYQALYEAAVVEGSFRALDELCRALSDCGLCHYTEKE